MVAPKLICFSVFGASPDYIQGAFLNIQAYRELLPDYTVRLYCGGSVPSAYIEKYLGSGAEVHLMKGHRQDWTATMWRFFALRDARPSHFLFRDADSRPLEREISAVRAWEASFKGFHVMRDHPAHHAAILAGMWGCTQQYAPELARRLPGEMRPSNDYHEHYDQAWLQLHVWPLAQKDGLTHASYWRTYFGPTEPFPISRKANEFVGEGLHYDGSPRYPDHTDLDALCRRCSCTIKCDK